MFGDLSDLNQGKASLLRLPEEGGAVGCQGMCLLCLATLLSHDPCWLLGRPCSSSFWVKEQALPGTSSGMLTQDRNVDYYFSKGSGRYQLIDAPAYIPRLGDRVCNFPAVASGDLTARPPGGVYPIHPTFQAPRPHKIHAEHG